MTGAYLRPLEKTVLPSRHVVFDTETTLRHVAGVGEHRFACAAVAWLDPSTTGFYVTSAESLWNQIVRCCRKGQRTVAWAHNLSFDLRIGEALRYLPRHGFHLEGIVLERTATWASWSSAEHGSLLCCDLYAWLPVPLDRIAREMGVERAPFEYDGADLPALQARCVEDVEITRLAVAAVLDWLKAEDCGSFFRAGKYSREGSITRSETGVYVHGDPALRAVEREAMWTGRCEAWRHGEVKGPLYEYDMNLAYCRIAATHELPVRLRGEHGELSFEQLGVLGRDGSAVLAEVDVTLEDPLVPARTGERMIWPVGSYTTTLWDPELALLPPDSFHVKRAWSYHRGPALKPMAEWIIEGLAEASTPAPIKLLLKHWARALIGRMALRYRRWEDYGVMPDLGLSLFVGYDEDGAAREYLQVGHDRFELAELAETETSVPQVTGWVMSQCRAQLWRFIEAIGPEKVVYMDTDSLLLNEIEDRWVPIELELLEHFELKTTWTKALIHGPRNLELDSERRLSGVPRSAVRTGPLSYEGETWRGIKESLVRSEIDHVAVLPRRYSVQSNDPRRERRADGTTAPYRLEASEQ